MIVLAGNIPCNDWCAHAHLNGRLIPIKRSKEKSQKQPNSCAKPKRHEFAQKDDMLQIIRVYEDFV